MDPRTHKRFLDYMELRGYFARPGLPKLDAATFERLDAQLAELLGRASLDAEETCQVAELRRLLLRD